MSSLALHGKPCPITANLEITTSLPCPVDCHFCPQPLLKSRYGGPHRLAVSVFMDCLDKVPMHVRIDFGGMGEPWANPDCSQLLGIARNRGYRLAMHTTLVGLKPKHVSLLQETEFEEFSVHVPDQQGNTLVQQASYADLLRQVTNGGIKVANGMKVSCHGAVRQDLVHIVEAVNLPVYNQLNNRAGNLEGVGAVVDKFGQKNLECSWIGLALDRNVMLPDGTVLLCCMDYGMEHVLGNLLQQSYDTIVNGPMAEKVRHNLRTSEERLLCHSCAWSVPSKQHWTAR